MLKQVCLLGATGSIGESTLKVMRLNRNAYALHSIVAQRNAEKMLSICLEFTPQYAVLVDPMAAKQLSQALHAYGSKTIVLNGTAAVNDIAMHPEVDIVVAGIVGSQGLLSALSAVRAGKTILLANKESLVMSGEIFMRTARESGARILPIDSEHNALFQCLPKDSAGFAETIGVEKLTLTASGGPFRELTQDALAHVTLSQALQHPNWVMGAKVTLDSASLMNKGLELIEAHFLFDLPVEQLAVLIHPQSIIHSLVTYKDGSVLAQLGAPDMCIPIAHALAYPQRIASSAPMLDLVQIGQLQFEAPDLVRFPCLKMAFDCLTQPHSYLVVLNAANEIAVAALLNAQIRFVDVPNVIAACLDKIPARIIDDIDTLLAFDTEVRQVAISYVTKMASKQRLE